MMLAEMRTQEENDNVVSKITETNDGCNTNYTFGITGKLGKLF